MIATAESCTGGLISSALTSIPGSSEVFDRSFITYSYASKTEMLGVSADLLSDFGAVSEEVALAMAQGALTRSAAHLTIAVTGVAGPGASAAKPEGLVWFASAMENAPTSAEMVAFGPLGRDTVRQRSVEHALKMLQHRLS